MFFRNTVVHWDHEFFLIELIKVQGKIYQNMSLHVWKKYEQNKWLMGIFSELHEIIGIIIVVTLVVSFMTHQ